MRNKYPGNCCICNKYVPAQIGHCERINKKYIYTGDSKQEWFVRCEKCVGKGAPWKQKCSTCGKKLAQGEGHYKKIKEDEGDGAYSEKWIAYCDKCKKE